MRGAQRGPYGSGDMDDGYTLVFENLEAFHAWREKEEAEKVVEFVKGDTHGSKAVPPRFKDHVKLICARHSRSGRKKYVKKYPERVRKVPSRKLDGKGCQASMSYKTYFDTPEVRVCYVSQHSHEIGHPNLPFTRRGRRAAVNTAAKSTTADPNSPAAQAACTSRPGGSSLSSNPGPLRDPSSSSHPLPSYPHFPSMSMPIPQGFGAPVPMLHPVPASTSAAGPGPAPALLPPPPPHAFPGAPSPPQAVVGTDRGRMERERWDRMDVLYQSVRNNARRFEYPAASVAALESVLVRMYFESPLPAPHTQSHPAYVTASVPPAQVAPPQQPEDIAMGHGDQSDDSESDEDDDEDEE